MMIETAIGRESLTFLASSDSSATPDLAFEFERANPSANQAALEQSEESLDTCRRLRSGQRGQNIREECFF